MTEQASVARELGRLIGVVEAAFQEDVTINDLFVAFLSATIATEVSNNIEEGITFARTHIRPRNGPPEVSALDAANRMLPLAYPFQRQSEPWPPFIGHRFALGGDST